MKILRKAADLYKKLEIFVLSVLFFIAFIVIILEVFSRFVLGRQFTWTDEFSTMLQFVISFLGIGYGIRTKKHIRVDGLYNQFPPTVQHLINIAADIVFIMVSVSMIKAGILICKQNWNARFGTFALYKGRVFAIAPVAYVISILYCVMDIIDEVLMIFHKDTIFNFGK